MAMAMSSAVWGLDAGDGVVDGRVALAYHIVGACQPAEVQAALHAFLARAAWP
jgi:hypothetical protein